MDQILLVFMAVAEKRNFSRAAEELHMTQPSVSQQIQLLEKQIGAKLLIRTNKYVQLTKAGEIVYLHAKEITSLYKRMSTLVNDLMNEASGHLKIGASYTFGEYVLPQILAEMKRLFPNVIPSVQIGNTREIVQAALSYQIDIGIVEGEATHTNLNIQPFANDEMYIIAGTKSEIFAIEAVTLNQIENETWIVREEGSGTREATERLFELLKIRPKNIIEFGSTQLIKEAVEAGMGITYLSELAIKKEKQLNTIDYLKVEGTPIQRNFSIITDKIELQTKSMEIFIELVKKYYEK
ncbi:LysR family transcriptional regulator [Gottfriedia acidiceleris]|uniref:LysR family transcriptional regulator n=1 Tax=Gottfriedia acidiceleris TaxID=371036 RepID=UPI002F265EC0